MNDSEIGWKSVLVQIHNIITQFYTFAYKILQIKKKFNTIFNVQICNFSTFRDPLFYVYGDINAGAIVAGTSPN